MNIKLSIIVPCYNEEKRFEDGFDHYFSYLKNCTYSWELILVNDGSRDKTLNLMQKLSRKNQNIRIISYHKNQGKGYAIIQGVMTAKGKYILFSDLDHSVSVETIGSFFKYFDKGYKVVIGSRRVKGSRFLKRQPFFRESLGRGFTLLVRFLIDWQIRDATCGFKAFENKLAKKIFAKITIFDWAFDAEILYLCRKFKIDFFQAPVTWGDVHGSKVSLKKDVLGSLIGLLKIRYNDFKGVYN